MNRNKANGIMNVLFAVIALSCVLRLVLPNIRISELSPFSVIGGIAAIALVAHIFLYVAPADRAARDNRNTKM